MIINWSTSDLERVFAGLSRTLKMTGNKKYYEYRRNLLPYAIWVQQNLDYDELAELTKTYIDYIDQVEEGQEYVKNNSKPVNPKRWWKSITKSNLTTILMGIEPDIYYSWNDRPIKDYVDEIENPSGRKEAQRHIAFYQSMWEKIGPLNLLFWSNEYTPSYSSGRSLWKSLPWQLRMKIRAANIRIVLKESGYYGGGPDRPGFKDFKSVYHSLTGGRAYTEQWRSDMNIPSFDTVKKFWSAFFNVYMNQIKITESRYHKNKSIYYAYNSFNSEVKLYLETGLVDIDKALQIVNFVRGSQPVVNLSQSRKSTLPSEALDFHTFTQLATNLGFDPELPTFLIHLCSKCDGAGGKVISDKIRVCSTCKGLGVDIEGEGSGGIPKLYYPAGEVTSQKKKTAVINAMGTLFSKEHSSRLLKGLLEDIEDALQRLNAITPNYK